MRSSRVVRTAKVATFRCSIPASLRHSGIRGALLNKVLTEAHRTEPCVQNGQQTEYTYLKLCSTETDSAKGLQRDVVYLGWPIASSYLSPTAGGRGKLRGLNQWVQHYSGAQINLKELALTKYCETLIIRELQRGVVYLGWPIAPWYMSPNAGGPK